MSVSERLHTVIDYPITPTPSGSVSLEDGFWLPRLEINRTVSIPAVFRKCEESGRVDNFRRAAGSLPGPYVGKMPFEDTDVYKAIEGASYSLAQHPDPELDRYLDGLIALIGEAQEPDGYLYTNRTIDPAHVLPFAGPERWSNLVMSHELYNCGHLYEAASAHFLSTGKRTLLDIALRNAALIRGRFRPRRAGGTCAATRSWRWALRGFTASRWTAATWKPRAASWRSGAGTRPGRCTRTRTTQGTARTTRPYANRGRRSGTRCARPTCTAAWRTWRRCCRTRHTPRQ